MRNGTLLIAERDFAKLAPLAVDGLLAEELSRATVVPEEHMPKNVVQMYSRVTYLDERSGERYVVELVLPREADPGRGRVSVLAPVGSALLGLEEGDAIEWPFPYGHTRRLRVERTLAPAG